MKTCILKPDGVVKNLYLLCYSVLYMKIFTYPSTRLFTDLSNLPKLFSKRKLVFNISKLWEYYTCMIRINLDEAIKIMIFENSLPCESADFRCIC